MTVRKSILSAALAVPLATGLVHSPLRAADVLKLNNTTALNLDGSWSGGAVPGSGDVAVWDSTVLGDNMTSVGVLANGNLSFAGLRIANPGGTVSFIASTASLTLGASGIDLTGSADLTLGTNNTVQSLVLGADQTWSIGTGRTLRLRQQWAITGSGNLNIQGPGTLLLSTIGTQTFGSGTLTLGGGLKISRASSTASANFTNEVRLGGNIALENSVFSDSGVRGYLFSGGLNVGSATRSITLSSTDATYDPAADSRYAAVLRMQGAVVGTGTLELLNGNSGVNLGKSVVAYSETSGAIGVSDLRIGSGVELALGAGGALTANTAVTVNEGGVLNLSRRGSVTAYSQTIKSLAGSGTVSNIGNSATATSTLTINGGSSMDTTTFSGVIEDSGTRKVALTKTGSNTQILSGDNTYTGATAVNAGTLLVNGSLGNTAVTVTGGGTLGGTGTIAGATTINSGGILSPGSSPGTLTFDGNLTLNNGSAYRFESGDLVDVNGTLDLNDTWTLALVGNETTFAVGGFTVLFTYTTLAVSPSLTPTFDLTALTGLGIGPGDLTVSNDVENSRIILTGISVVPEPSVTILLGVAGMAGLFYRRRR